MELLRAANLQGDSIEHGKSQGKQRIPTNHIVKGEEADQQASISCMAKGDLSGLVGKHVKYTYNNGWQYEVYYRNDSTVDYKVLSGLVAGRCVKGQEVNMRQLLGGGSSTYMVSWAEPTGTCVSTVVDFENRDANAVVFFPFWVEKDPTKTICFQNDHLPLMVAYRDTGPTYPLYTVHLRGVIHFVEDCPIDNDQVISYTLVTQHSIHNTQQ